MISRCLELVRLMDVGGKYAGTVSGSMNMMGNLAGVVAPSWAGLIRDAGYDWNIFLYSMAAVYLLGGFCWPFIDPVTPLEGRRSSIRSASRNSGLACLRPMCEGAHDHHCQQAKDFCC